MNCLDSLLAKILGFLNSNSWKERVIMYLIDQKIIVNSACVANYLVCASYGNCFNYYIFLDFLSELRSLSIDRKDSEDVPKKPETIIEVLITYR